LIFHVGSTSASAYVLKIDDIKIGPSNYIFGSPITDWQAVTPTFTGLGTVTSIEVYSRRNGDNLEIEGNFTTGTTTGTEARISLNYRGANVTSTAIPSIRKAGEMFFSSAAAAVGTMLIEPSVTYLTLGSQSAGNAGLTKQLGTTYASSSKHTFSASVPILGWSSSTQMSDSADTRVVSARAYRSSNQSVSTAAETDSTRLMELTQFKCQVSMLSKHLFTSQVQLQKYSLCQYIRMECKQPSGFSLPRLTQWLKLVIYLIAWPVTLLRAQSTLQPTRHTQLSVVPLPPLQPLSASQAHQPLPPVRL
jgi:hypothetical protein